MSAYDDWFWRGLDSGLRPYRAAGVLASTSAARLVRVSCPRGEEDIRIELRVDDSRDPVIIDGPLLSAIRKSVAAAYQRGQDDERNFRDTLK